MIDPFDDAEYRSLIEEYHDDSCNPVCKCQPKEDDETESYDVEGDR